MTSPSTTSLVRAVRALGLLLAVIVGLGQASPAHAQDRDWQLKVVVPKAKAVSPAATADEGEDGEDSDSEEEAKAGPTPFMRAILGGRVGLTAKDLILKQTDLPEPLVLKATKSVNYRDSDEPMALVVLVQGNFRWLGNETYTDPADPEAGSIYDGAFKGLGPAIDVLAKAGPSGSQAALYVFTEGQVLVKQAMGDASALSSSALGSQQDYSEYISKPFIVGLNEAWKTLANMADHRKILVIFGDGQDDKEDVTADLKKVTSELKAAGVEVYTIFYTAMPEDGPQGQQNMAKVGYTDHLTATSRDNFVSLADNIVEIVGAKYYVDFDSEAMTWDGLEHEFVLAVSGEEREPKLLTLPALVVKKKQESSLWWLWLLLAVTVLAFIVIIVIVRRRRRQPVVYEEPPPMPMPVPAGPMKTVMLGIGGNEESLPIVGWVVPLSGPNQYQTFKLSQGATKLGTGGASQIVVGDGFMSAEHAEIVCSASGFQLNDLGSTNGTYINAKRVATHSLVDNDVFKLGKTNFKFKSIN